MTWRGRSGRLRKRYGSGGGRHGYLERKHCLECAWIGPVTRARVKDGRLACPHCKSFSLVTVK